MTKNAEPSNIGRSLSDTSRECRYLDFQIIFWRKLMFSVAVEHRDHFEEVRKTVSNRGQVEENMFPLVWM